MPTQRKNRRSVAEEWIPPKMLRLAHQTRARFSTATKPGGHGAVAGTSPDRKARRKLPPAQAARPVLAAGQSQDPRWRQITERTLAGLESCDPVYRPTNFWSPGVERLLNEMQIYGVETFKSWPEAFTWFYPTYGSRLSGREIRKLVQAAQAVTPRVNDTWLRSALKGTSDARRDFDAARLSWNHENWPVDLDAHGESELGQPAQHYALTGHDGPRWSKPYLNYLLCMAALSQHVTTRPKSFLELGGGFGTLGEIVMSRDPEARYINADIPPLLTVSSYYLSTLFGDDRVLTYDSRVPDAGPVDAPRSACLPNWRMTDLAGPFDVFVNSFSFQEMEPHVVEHYLDNVRDLDVSYVVSLNSRKGKALATLDGKGGVKEQVTSSRIIAMLETRGYELCATHNRPLLVAAGELAVLRKI